MYRAATERSRTRRVWRAHLRQHEQQLIRSGGHGVVTCTCDQQMARFRKGQRIGGCNRPGCLMCHYEKVMGILRIRDLRQLAREQDAVLEARL